MDNSGSDKYTLGGLDTTSVTIEFLAGAALDNTSVVTVEITKVGYVINGGAAIAVVNTIPVPVVFYSAVSAFSDTINHRQYGTPPTRAKTRPLIVPVSRPRT